MNTQKINEHLSILRQAQSILILLRQAEDYRREFPRGNAWADEKINSLLEEYAEKIASLTPQKFLESKVLDMDSIINYKY